MKQFEVGKSYKVQGYDNNETITVIKRTPCYITFTGDYSGRQKICKYGDNGLFGMGECILVDYNGYVGKFVFASREV